MSNESEPPVEFFEEPFDDVMARAEAQPGFVQARPQKRIEPDLSPRGVVGLLERAIARLHGQGIVAPDHMDELHATLRTLREQLDRIDDARARAALQGP